MSKELCHPIWGPQYLFRDEWVICDMNERLWVIWWMEWHLFGVSKSVNFKILIQSLYNGPKTRPSSIWSSDKMNVQILNKWWLFNSSPVIPGMGPRGASSGKRAVAYSALFLTILYAIIRNWKLLFLPPTEYTVKINTWKGVGRRETFLGIIENGQLSAIWWENSIMSRTASVTASLTLLGYCILGFHWNIKHLYTQWLQQRPYHQGT